MFNNLHTIFIVIFTCISINSAQADDPNVFGPDAFNQPMSFINAYNGGNCVGCEWMAAEGIITAETPAAFKKFLSKNFRLSLVINSNGGDLAAALELGKIIRDNQLEVSIGHAWTDITSQGYKDGFRYHEIIEGVCTNQCVYAFLGGVSRYARVGGFGLTPSATSGVSSNELSDYVKQMGVKNTAFTSLINSASTAIYFPTEAELIHSGVDNVTNLFSKPTLLPYGKNGKVLEISHLSGYYSTPKTPRRFRLYCRGSAKTPHFTILQNPLVADMQDQDDWANIVDQVKSINIQFNKGGFVTLPVKVAAHFDGKQNKALAFELRNLSLDKFKDIKSLNITLQNVPREFTPIINRLYANFGEVNQLLNIALQNCID